MIRFFQDKVVGFHVGLGCKPKPHMQGLAASDGSWSTDNGVLFCWLPCWFPAFGEVTMGKVPWGSMLGPMLVSKLQGMGKSPWERYRRGSMLGAMLAFMLGSSCLGMGGGHHGKDIG